MHSCLCYYSVAGYCSAAMQPQTWLRATILQNHSVPFGTIKKTPRKVSSHTTGPHDITSICSSTVPIKPPVIVPDRLLQDRQSDNPINLALQNKPIAAISAQPIEEAISNRSHWVLSDAVRKVSEDLASQLHMKLDTKIGRTVHQLLDSLLPAGLGSALQFLTESSPTASDSVSEKKDGADDWRGSHTNH